MVFFDFFGVVKNKSNQIRMVNKNKAAAKVVTADSTLRMMIEDQKCYRYNLFFTFQ